MPIATDQWDTAERLKTATTGIPSSVSVSMRPSATCAMRCTSAGAPFCPTNSLCCASARDDRALAVEDADHPIRRNLLARQDLAEAFREDSHGKGEYHFVAPAHGDVEGDDRPAHDLADENIGDGGLPGFEQAAQLDEIAAQGKRLAEWPQRVDELLARSIAQDQAVARQVAHRVLGLAVKGGKITRCQMSGSGEHQQCDLANCKLAVDGLRQSTCRLQRSLFDDLALAVVGIADQQGSSERGRYHRHGYKANELALKCHDRYEIAPTLDVRVDPGQWPVCAEERALQT